MKRLLLTYSSILLAGHVILVWLLFYSPLGIPAYIPNTQINIGGLLIICLTITVLIFFNKAIISTNPFLPIWKQVLWSGLICFIAELIFQLYYLLLPEISISKNTYQSFIFRTLTMSIYTLILSFFVVFQMKTKRTSLTILFIIGFIYLYYFLTRYFPGSIPS